MNTSRLHSTRNDLNAESREKIDSCSTSIWPTRLTSTARRNRLIGTSKVLISPRCTSCSISLPHNLRKTLTPSPRGRPPWAAQHGAPPVSPPPLRDCRSTHSMRRLVCSTLKPWPCATPHLPQPAGRRSTQPVNSATPTQRTCSPKSHGVWTSPSGFWRATCKRSLWCRE